MVGCFEKLNKLKISELCQQQVGLKKPAVNLKVGAGKA